ncbi:type II RES/Xre toxin-antitoxin system antitoxin [Geopseudomonas aromaticivorans]
MSTTRNPPVRPSREPSTPLTLLYGKHPPKAQDAFEIHRLIKKGFPSDVVITVVRSVAGIDKHAIAQVLGMSERTLQRRLKQPEPLTPEQSSNAWRFASTLCKAEVVFGDRQAAAEWLMAPAIGLNREVPMDLLTTQAGYELVDDYLTRMEHGVYS